MPKVSSSFHDLDHKSKASTSSIPKRARKRVKPDHPINNHSGSPGKPAGRSPDATYDEKKDTVYLHFAGIRRSSYHACLLNTRFIPSCAGMDPKELVRKGGRDDVETALRNAEIFGTPPARRATERVAERYSDDRPGSSGEGAGDTWAGPPIPILDDDAMDVDPLSPSRPVDVNNADRTQSPTPIRGKKTNLSHKKVTTQPVQRKRTIIPGSPIPPKKSMGRPTQSGDQPKANASQAKRDVDASNRASKAIRTKVTKDHSQRDASQAKDDAPMFIQGSSSMPLSSPFRRRQVDAFQADDTPILVQGSRSASPTNPFGNSGRSCFEMEFASTASPPRFETPPAEMDESALYDYLYGFGAPVVKLPPSRFKDDMPEHMPMDVNDEPIVLETRASPHLDYSDYLHQDDLPPSLPAGDAIEGATVVNEELVELSLTHNDHADYLHPDNPQLSQPENGVSESATAVVNSGDDEETMPTSPPSPIRNGYSDSDARPPSQSCDDAIDIALTEVNHLPAVPLSRTLKSPARNNCTEYLHPDDNLPHPSLGSPMTSGQNGSELMNELFGDLSPLSDEEVHHSLVNTPPPTYHGTIDPVLLGGGRASEDAPILDEIRSAPSQFSLSGSPSRSATPPRRSSISDPINTSQGEQADIEMEDVTSQRKDNSEGHLLPSTQSSTPRKASSSSRTLDVPPSRRSAPKTSNAPPVVVVCRRKEVYVSSQGACVKIVGEPDDLDLLPPKLKAKPKPSLKRRASRSVSPPPDRPHRVHKRPTKYRSPSPVPDFPAPVYHAMPLPTGPLAYWATIYGMSGQRLATAFTGGDAAEVVVVKPIQPSPTLVEDQPAPRPTVPRRFVGKVQPSWGCGPDPYVTDAESDSSQGTKVKKKDKERQRKIPYACRFIGDPSLLYAKFQEHASEAPPLSRDSSDDIMGLRDSSPLTPVPTTPGSSDVEWVSWERPNLPSSTADSTKHSVCLEDSDVARAIVMALSSTSPTNNGRLNEV
ncbi:hypothetical protein EYR40_002058 [Pleurotus pulmonarius]|nr:hypothetical protein EYR40_002058 [Pleurotus pulmonarius]